MLVLLVLLMGCGLVALAAWIYVRDRGGLDGILPSSTGTPGPGGQGPGQGPAPTGQCGPAGEFGPVPSWASKGASLPQTEPMYAKHKQTVASKDCWDFLLYGDSITAFLTNRDPAVFKKYFGDRAAAPLGIGGNTVEQLAWRITGGNERPARAPGVIALNIGVNNTPKGNFATTAAHTEELLKWLKKAYPSTKIVLMALLPASRWGKDIDAANRMYRDVARRVGATFAECGQGMDPTDTRLYSDGLHPTSEGHDVVLRCLKGVVDGA